MLPGIRPTRHSTNPNNPCRGEHCSPAMFRIPARDRQRGNCRYKRASIARPYKGFFYFMVPAAKRGPVRPANIDAERPPLVPGMGRIFLRYLPNCSICVGAHSVRPFLTEDARDRAGEQRSPLHLLSRPHWGIALRSCWISSKGSPVISAISSSA